MYVMKFDNYESGTLIDMIEELRENAISTNSILHEFGCEIDLKTNGAKLVEDMIFELGTRTVTEWTGRVIIPAK